MSEQIRFGEKIELPKGYGQFWEEYLQALAKEDLDGDYFSRRVDFLLPESGRVARGNAEHLVLSNPFKSVPAVMDVYTYFWMRDDANGSPTRPASHDKETIIHLKPEIRTVLFESEIRRYRNLSPEQEHIMYFNNGYVGNPNLVGVLLAIFDDYTKGRSNALSSYVVEGNEIMSTPSSYPIESDIVELYGKIGRRRLDMFAREYFGLQKTLREARSISPAAASELERTVCERFASGRSEIVASL